MSEPVSTRDDGLAVVRETLDDDCESPCAQCGAWARRRYRRSDGEDAIACDLRCAELRWWWKARRTQERRS